ncbi:MAG: hypothetical protein JNM84_18925 [Planctomycetes bacterium]|nr:hypothetical protein [Planctomycetota bacterium]
MNRLLALLSNTTLVMLLIASSSLNSARAADWYVDADNGSDNGAGNLASPWRTISYTLQQPLNHGDAIMVRGLRASFSTQESFPIRLPAGISLRTWDSSSTAVIDAGTGPCILIDGDGHYNQAIDGDSRSITLSGIPAVWIRPSGPSALLNLSIRGLNIEGNVLLDHDITRSVLGGHSLQINDCHISGSCSLHPAHQSPYQYMHILRAYVSNCRILGGLSAIGINDTLAIDRCDVDQGIMASEGSVTLGGYTSISSCRVRSGDLSASGSLLLEPIISDCIVDSGSIRASAALDCDALVTRCRASSDIDVNAYFDATCTDSTAGDEIRVGGSDVRIERNRCFHLVAVRSQSRCEIIGNYVVGRGIELSPAVYGLSTWVADNYVEATSLPSSGAAIDAASAWNLVGNFVRDNAGCPIGIRGDQGLLDNTIEGFDIGAMISGIAQNNRACARNTFVECRITALQSSAYYGVAEIRSNLFINCAGTALNLSRAAGNTSTLELGDNIFLNNNSDISPSALQQGDLVTNNHSTSGTFNSYHASNQGGAVHLQPATLQLLSTSPCIGASSTGGSMGPPRLGQFTPELRIADEGHQATLRWTPPLQPYNGLGAVLIGAYPAMTELPFANGLLGLAPQSYLATLHVQFREQQTIVLSFPLPGGPVESAMQGLRIDTAIPGGLRLTNTVIFRIL